MATKDTRSNKPIKSWFITIPQSGDFTLTYVLEKLSVFQFNYAKLVKELHQDGNPHIHIVIQYKTPHTKNAIIAQLKVKFPFDWKRIHVQSLGSKSMADVYLGKDAQDTLETGTFETTGKQKKVRLMPAWIAEASSGPDVVFLEPVRDEFNEIIYAKQRRDCNYRRLLLEYRTKYAPWELPKVQFVKINRK